MVLCPAPPNTGYLFKIKKKNSYTQIKADFNNVQSTKLCTLISDKEGNTVSTIEHVLSACYGIKLIILSLSLIVMKFLFVMGHPWISLEK